MTLGPRGVQRTIGVPGSGIFYTSRSGYHSGFHSAHVENPIAPERQAVADRTAEALMALAALVLVALVVVALASIIG